MLTIENYIKKHLNQAFKYAKDIESGAVISNQWLKLAVNRFNQDRNRNDLIENIEAVKKVYAFFALINISINNVFKQYDLHPYQSFIILNLFLFYYKDTGRRRFRYMFLFVARKNAKTTFAVALNLYFLVLDGVINPRSLLLASTREQAGIGLDAAKSMVNNSPALKKRLTCKQYEIEFIINGSHGKLKTVASDAKTLDGYDPSSAILDEIHAYKDAELFNVIKSGIIARANPMVLLISTAGARIDTFCYSMVQYGQNVLNGSQTDDSFLFILYMLDEADDFNDPKNWLKANPGLGIIQDFEALNLEYKSAKNLASNLPNFLTKNLNVFIETSDAWLPNEVLARTKQDFKIENLKHLPCYIGLDLSSTRDLTSAVVMFYDSEIDKYYFYSKFWFANNPNRRLRQNGIDLRAWIKQGYIQQCQTETIDFELIFQWFENFSKEFSIECIAYDSYNSALLVPQLENLGINCEDFPQNPKTFNFPLKYLERIIYSGAASFGLNPVLQWNFRNIVLYEDGNQNIKIMKNKSRDSVDGAVSAAMALAAWMKINLDPQKAGLDQYLNYNNN